MHTCAASTLLVPACRAAQGLASLRVVGLVRVNPTPRAGRLAGTRVPVATGRLAAFRLARAAFGSSESVDGFFGGASLALFFCRQPHADGERSRPEALDLLGYRETPMSGDRLPTLGGRGVLILEAAFHTHTTSISQ